MSNNIATAWLEIWRTQRRWFLLRSLCALIWAGELYFVQNLAFEAIPWIGHPILVQGFRFYLDALLALTLVLLVKRRFLSPLLALNLVCLAVTGTYAAFFHWPLMPMRAYSQWREGWSLHSGALDIISWQTLAAVVGAYVAQILLLAKSGRSPLPASVRWRTLALAVLLYVLPIAGLQVTNLRLRVGVSGGMGRTVFVYGYALPWACEALANSSTRQHTARARAYLTHHYDRISPLEPPLSIPGHVVVLQLESVCGHAIEANYQGSWAMPFLRDLRNQSLYFRIFSFHKNGSCDMDFAATTFTEPYPGMVPYRIPGMTYTNGLPAFMKAHGYRTYVFHGNTGLFYDRGLVLRELGFDHLIFKEQLAPLHLPESLIGVRDTNVFQCALQALRSERRAYVFVITLDTHVPFEALAPAEMEMFPRPADPVERYFNSLRYLDNCLRDFFRQIPDGTTVVLYGDHSAGLNSDYFHSDIVDGNHYVGCLIAQKGRDLAPRQRTREQPIATDGSLNLLDVLSYLRHSMEVCPLPAPAPAAPRDRQPPAGATAASLAGEKAAVAR